MSNFGANFRKAREAKGLPLEKIAAETRISTRFLTAIENEAFELLPGGIFNRGFIRAYADYLGLDSNQAVADYDRMSSVNQEPADVLRDVDRVPARSSDWNLYLVAAAILIVLMVAYYFVTRNPSTGSSQQTPAVASTTQPAQPPLDVPVPTETPTPLPETLKTPPSPDASAAAQTATPPVTPVPSKPTPSVVPPPASPSTSALAVNVNVTDSTWMEVTTDGTVALAEILEPGANRHFSAERSIDVTIGNAAGATMQINGRDLGQLGTTGRVRKFKITPENAAQIR
jgi:cytoskeletal protein RodZ